MPELSSRERVLRAVAGQRPDRLPIKHEARDSVNRALLAHLGLSDELSLYDALGDDFRRVRPIYRGPELR